MRIAGATHRGENALAIVRDQVEQLLFVRHVIWASLDTEWLSNRDDERKPRHSRRRDVSRVPGATTGIAIVGLDRGDDCFGRPGAS